MKYLLLIVLALALLWIASIAWTNRRKSPYDTGGSNGSSGDGGSGYPSHCDSTADGGCGGGGDGGGGGD